ncbi:MAG TPA: family 16 glycoside hydrolase [Bryobacteraceae bacterium]|nr:family 16 glycoside hydrolase [Bryobacteraceae bacterium]
MLKRSAAVICVTCVFIAIATRGLSQTDGERISPEDLAAIQTTVERLLVAVNDRDAKAVYALTVPSFDARGENMWFDRDGQSRFGRSNASLYKGVEIAALVRGARLITNDVALAEGFFRTTRWLAGDDPAGSLMVTLVKRDGKWLAANARFASYRFSDGSTIMVKPVAPHSAAGSEGWIGLFDGSSLEAFTGPAGEPVSGCWRIDQGLLTLDPQPGLPNRSIRTKDTFGSFELRFDWKVAAKANSGVKYRLFYLHRSDASGHEYQLADDAGDPGAIQNATERSGALYNQIAPSKPAVRPAGEWNSSAIIVRGRHCEHWLNGEKVVEYETNSGPLVGPLVFQNHQSQAWFRDVKIRRLD